MSALRQSIRLFLRAQGISTPSRALVLCAVVAAGLTLSAWSWTGLRANSYRADRADSIQAARERVELLRSQLLRSTEILNSITAYFSASTEITRPEFSRFVSPALQRQPELQALEWIPRVPAARRHHYEQLAASDGLDGFRITEFSPDGRLVPASDRPEYYPVFYVEPLRGNAPALGLDLAHHPHRRAALDAALASGQPVATAPIQLAQAAPLKPGFLIFAPVRDPRGELLGFSLAVFRVDRLIAPSLAPLADRGLHLEVHDEAAPATPLYATGTPRAAPRPSDWSHRETLAFAGRQWRIDITPGATFAAPTPGLIGWTAPAGILALAALLSGYLLAGYRRTAEIEQKVAEKTAQLSAEVAERQRAEAAALEAERRFRSIFENAIDGIFQSTPEGRYLRANPALARIYGFDTPDGLLAAFSDIARQLYVEPGRRDEFVRTVAAQGSVSDFVSEVRRRDGSVIWISEKALAVRDPATHKILYFEGIVEDVTERVRTADQLRRTNEILEERVAARTAELAQANRAKSLFLADMSHELRTPLNAVLGYTQLLQLDTGLTRAQTGALQAIVEGGNHLLCLVDGVLDLTKIEVGRMELEPVEFDLNVLIRGLAAMFTQRAGQKRLDLRVERPATGPLWLRGDERKLRQILVNLLNNAVKFTDRGEVRLRVIPDEAPGVFRFEVIDTGAGIPTDAQASIFEPFHQAGEGRAKGGTGLGLSISRRFVALMGGELAVNSTPGWGSNFFFTLALEPVSTLDAAPESYPLAAPRLAPGHTVRALVVDDLAVNRDILGRMLAHIGCDVVLAADHAETAARFSKNPPDIAFIDLRLPDGDGVSLVQSLRAARPGLATRFVSYSASAFEHDRARCLAAGFDGVLPKPLRFAHLAACLQNLLGVSLFTTAPSPPPSPLQPFSPSALPPDLLALLRTAAEIGDCATLRDLLDQAGPGAAGLLPLVDRFDTDALLALLEDKVPIPRVL
jgi:PAS domain S-box-containing protein